MASNKINTVFFDLFGTLLCDDQITKYSAFLAEVGFNLNPSSKKYVKKIFLTKQLASLPLLCKELCIDTKKYMDIIDRYEDIFTTEIKNIKPIDGAVDLIKYLKKENIRCFVLSNIATPYIRAYESSEFYSVPLISGTLFSCECGLMKPDPKFFLKALKGFRADPTQTIMVGNNQVEDVEGAESVGMNAFLVGTPECQLQSIITKIF